MHSAGSRTAGSPRYTEALFVNRSSHARNIRGDTEDLCQEAIRERWRDRRVLRSLLRRRRRERQRPGSQMQHEARSDGPDGQTRRCTVTIATERKAFVENFHRLVVSLSPAIAGKR